MKGEQKQSEAPAETSSPKMLFSIQCLVYCLSDRFSLRRVLSLFFLPVTVFVVEGDSTSTTHFLLSKLLFKCVKFLSTFYSMIHHFILDTYPSQD